MLQLRTMTGRIREMYRVSGDKDANAADTKQADTKPTKIKNGSTVLVPKYNRDNDGTALLKSATTHILCTMYGLMLTVFGAVFPISIVLSDNELGESYFLEVFQLYIYGVSVIFLAYMHFYLMSYKEDYRDITRLPKTCVELGSSCDARGACSCCDVGRGNSPALDGVGKITTGVIMTVDKDNPDDKGEIQRSNIDISGFKWSSLSPPAPPVSYAQEGINFYLRLGAIGFGLGSMIHDGFYIAQVFQGALYRVICYTNLDAIVSAAHITFTFCQTFFVFKNHKVVINMHKVLVRFGIMHIVATNICCWLVTTVVEANEDFRTISKHGLLEKQQQHQQLQPDHPHHQQHVSVQHIELNESIHCNLETNLARRTAPYLFPCTIEYSLIAAAVMYKIYQNVGHVSKLESSRRLPEMPEDRHDPTDCHKANKGLFFGLFTMVFTFIAMGSFFMFSDGVSGVKDSEVVATFIFMMTEIVLLSVSMISVVVGFIKMRVLRFTSFDDTFDATLLVVALCGVFLYNTFSAVSAIRSIPKYGSISTITVVTAVVRFVEGGLQTLFILEGLRRSAQHSGHVHQKPGRALVTFLLLCNLSLWVVNTFEVQKAEAVPAHTEYYGERSWGIISFICVPLIIFFRFHSTVCLADIWTNAYRLERKDL